MSRIGKKPTEIPAKTEVTLSGNILTVKGPLGQLSKVIRTDVIDVLIEDKQVSLSPKNESLETKALWGTFGSHIKNMIAGVNQEYVIKLIIEGVGYKADIQGTTLVMNLGFSHQVKLDIPKGLTCKVEKGEVTISGIDKEVVGQFAAVIRSKKKPEPYKGKGIRYSDEVIRRKEGKKSV
jgi:large subunit ribosomal protein L6